MKTEKNVRKKKRKTVPAPKTAKYSVSEMAAIKKFIRENFGECENVFHERVSSGIHVDIGVIPPSEERDCLTLVTMGMGAYRMRHPAKYAECGLERAELAIALPPDWKLDEESLEDDRWNWPIRLLTFVARIPIQYGSGLACRHAVRNDRDVAYAENTKLCGCILIDPPAFGGDRAIVHLPGGDPVNFYQLLPLYKEELDYNRQYGLEALLAKLSGVVSWVVDPSRPCAI